MNPIYYEPELLETDFMAANPIGTTEYKFSEFNDDDETSYAWTDENISQHPSFYRSKFIDEKTNPGDFLIKIINSMIGFFHLIQQIIYLIDAF